MWVGNGTGYRVTKRLKETFHAREYVRYLDYGDDFTGINVPNCTW